jgi:hypothetical protein
VDGQISSSSKSSHVFSLASAQCSVLIARYNPSRNKWPSTCLPQPVRRNWAPLQAETGIQPFVRRGKLCRGLGLSLKRERLPVYCTAVVPRVKLLAWNFCLTNSKTSNMTNCTSMGPFTHRPRQLEIWLIPAVQEAGLIVEPNLVRVFLYINYAQRGIDGAVYSVTLSTTDSIYVYCTVSHALHRTVLLGNRILFNVASLPSNGF